MTPDDPMELDGDLWSMPLSAKPADDLVEAAPPARRRRVPGKGMSLVIAMAVLIGLGYAAQRLDPSRGTASSSPGTASTRNPPRPASPTPASTHPNGAATVMTGGPTYCPMQAVTASLDCFFIG